MNTLHLTPNRTRNFHNMPNADFFNSLQRCIYTVAILSGILPTFIWKRLLLNWNLLRLEWKILEFTEAQTPWSACIMNKSA